MTNLLSFSFLITVMVFTVLGALLGLARGFKKSIVRIISVILSGVLAYLLAAPIAKLFINENSIHSIVSALNFEETYNELVTASPALEELFAALPIAIVAPLVFLVLFFVLKFLMNIPCIIVNTCLNFKSKDESAIRFLGLPIGAVQGFISIMALVVVLAGFIGIGDKVIDVVLEEDNASNIADTTVIEEIDFYIEELKRDPIVGMLCGSADNKEDLKKDSYTVMATDAKKGQTNNSIFEGLTTFKFREQKLKLSNELVAITDTAVQIIPLMEGGEGSGLTAKQIDAIARLAEKFSYSGILTEVGADLVSEACTKWSSGETFLGIEFKGVDPMVDPIVWSLLGAMKDSTAETLIVDLGSFVSILRTLNDYDLLSLMAGGSENILSKLSGQAISDLLKILSDNSRLNVVIPEVTNLSIRMLGTTLKIPENAGVIYDTVVNDLSSSLNNVLSSEMTEEDMQKFGEEVYSSLQSNGIEVDKEVATLVSSALTESFKELEGEVTTESIQKYFEDYAIIYEQIDNKENNSIAANKDNITLSGTVGSGEHNDTGFDFANMTYEEKLAKLAEADLLDIYNDLYDLTDCAPDTILPTGQRADAFVNYILIIYNHIYTNYQALRELGDASENPIVALKSSETIITTKTTIESLMVASGSCELSETDIKNIGEGFDHINEFIQSVGSLEGDMSLENLESMNVEAIGKALDALKDTSIFAGAVDPLAGAVISSATNVDITKELVDGNVSYSELMGTVKATAGLMNSLNSNDVDAKNASILQLIESITPQNANIIIAIVNEEFMIQQGVPAEYATASAKTLRTALTEMAEIDPSEREKEAYNIRYIFELATSLSKSDNIMGEDQLFTSAEEIIVVCVESKVVAATLRDLTTDENGNRIKDSLGVASKLTEENKEQVRNEIERYYEQYSSEIRDADELAALNERLEAVGYLFDLYVD